MSIYLDHAATSFPKPDAVLAAVERWFREVGVSADRGDGPLTDEVRSTVASARQRLATACGVEPHHVAFTSGATESLNLFLHGFLQRGDRVLTTGIEHSSVVRPLNHLRRQRGVEVEVLQPDAAGRVVPEQVEAALQAAPTRLLCFSHGSNVTGAVLDANALCRVAREHGCRTLVDASQTAGLLPLDFGADAVAASAHKSLLAPPGLGFLAIAETIELHSRKQGGTGSSTALAEHPTGWPTTMEAGTPNTPAIFGLDAALSWIDQQDPEHLLRQEIQVVDVLVERLLGHAQLHGPHNPRSDELRLPVLSFTLQDMDPMEAAIILAESGVHVRAGFHCAPWIHDYLGTPAGTIRVSVGPFATADDVLRIPRVLGCE